MARINKTRYALLGILAIGPMSGYEIAQVLLQTSYYWSESEGQIYPALRRLAQEGLIELCDKVLMKQGQGQPHKKTYRLTESGLLELREWLDQAAAYPSVRDELLLKLFLGNNLPPNTSQRHLDEFRMRLKAMLPQLKESRQCLQQVKSDNLQKKLYYIVSDYAYSMAQAQLQWVRRSQLLLQEDQEEKCEIRQEQKQEQE